MTREDLVQLILNNEDRIVEAISTGAQWEVWLQVEIEIMLRREYGNLGKNVGIAREVPYGDGCSLDLLVQDQDGTYAIELKVESANNSGRAVLKAASEDYGKIQNYNPGFPCSRCVVVVYYSDAATEAVHELINDPDLDTYYGEDRIGVLIVAV